MGILLIGLIVRFADTEEILYHLKNISLGQIIFLCTLQMFTIFLNSFQLYTLANLLNLPVALRKIFSVYMRGTFVESVTPSVKAGGEATKIYLLTKELDIPLGESSALVALQKTISFLAFLSINVFTMSWFMLRLGTATEQSRLLMGVFALLLVIFIGILSLIFWPKKKYGFLDKLPIKESRRDKLIGALINFEKNFRKMLARKKAMAFQFFLALFIWSFFALKAYLVVLFLGISLSFIEIAVVTYLTYMVGMLPLLPGGLGTFEGSMVFFVAPFGVGVSSGITLAIVLRFVTFWFVFLVSALYLLGRVLLEGKSFRGIIKLESLYKSRENPGGKKR